MEEKIHLRGLSHHTRDEYITRAKILMQYFNRPLEELTEQELRKILLYLLDEKGHRNWQTGTLMVQHKINPPAMHNIINLRKSDNIDTGISLF